jgi:hypothetical protein
MKVGELVVNPSGTGGVFKITKVSHYHLTNGCWRTIISLQHTDGDNNCVSAKDFKDSMARYAQLNYWCYGNEVPENDDFILVPLSTYY